MSDKPVVKVNNENNSWTGIWIFITVSYVLFRNQEENSLDLYDLIYQLLSKLGAN
jgi:hypothetical protein